MRLRQRVTTLLMLFGLVLAACGTGGGQQQGTTSGPKHGDTLKVAIGIDPDTLDPAARTPTTSSQTAGILPATLTQAPNKPEVITQPVGTGPYKFKERVAGDHITMDANKDYWGVKANYDTQTYKVVPEAASREALVKSGGADVIALPPANDLPALSADSTLKVVLGPSDRTIQIVINTQDTTQPLLQKPEVRQALNYAV